MGEEIAKKIGIMGGTFDPVHVGHLMLGECAYDQFQLDSVMFMPSGNPPHKQNRAGGATDQQRSEMVKLAISDNPHFQFAEEEMLRHGFTYTNETLQVLKKLHPENQYYFIIGGDSLMAFDTWKNPDIICQNCILLASIRDGIDLSVMKKKRDQLIEKFHAKIEFLMFPNMEISSSSIRTAVKEGHSIRYCVPETVRQYIEENNIYDCL